MRLRLKKKRKWKRIEVRETKKVGVLLKGGRYKQNEVEVEKRRRTKRQEEGRGLLKKKLGAMKKEAGCYKYKKVAS